MLKDLLFGQTYEQRHRIKSIALAKIGAVEKFERYGFDIEILSTVFVKDRLSVVLRAWKDGKEIEVNNPFEYINPPINVPDGTKSEMAFAGKIFLVDNFKEDVDEALKIIVAQTLKLICK